MSDLPMAGQLMGLMGTADPADGVGQVGSTTSGQDP